MSSLAPMRRATTCVLAAVALIAAGCGDESSDSRPTTVSVSAPTSSTTTARDEPTAPVAPDDSAGDPAAADDPGADRPRSIEDVVSAVLTGSETPVTICDSLVTSAYVKRAYGDREGCLAAQQPGSLAKSVDVGDVQEADASASAIAVPSGGPYDGVDVEVELVPARDLDGAWRVDSLLADVPAGP